MPRAALGTLVALVVLAGCASKTTHETSTPTSSSTPTSLSSSPAATPTAIAREPQGVLDAILKYGSSNDAPKSFDVPAAAAKLDVTVYLNYTTPGSSYTIQPAAGEANPYAEVKDPAGTTTRFEFIAGSGTGIGATSPRIAGPIAKSIAPATAGTWSIGISGTGTNVQVEAKGTARFA